MQATNNQEWQSLAKQCDETETLLFSNHSANLIEKWLDNSENRNASKEKHNNTFKSGRFNN